MRNKRLRRALLIGSFVLIAVGVWFAPTAKAELTVELGKETTYVTAPLADDGLPNYALAILEQQQVGVTVENNGAIEFWEALGPGDLSDEEYALICGELGIEQSADPIFLTDPLGDENLARVAEWIAKHKKSRESESEIRADFDEAEQIITLLMERPWSTDDLPPLAEWLNKNQKPLDLLVKAAAKPRFYSPSPDTLLRPNVAVFDTRLSHAGFARTAVRALALRANYRTANREYAGAWDDCLACWQLGSQIAQGLTAVEQLVGIAIHTHAMNCTLVLLQSKELPLHIADKVFRQLDSLPIQLKFEKVYEFAERLAFLDFSLRHITGRFGGVSETTRKVLHRVENIDAPIDPNIPLRIANGWFDRIAEAAAIDDPAERRSTLASLDEHREALFPWFREEIRRVMKQGGLQATPLQQVSVLAGKADVVLAMTHFYSANDMRDRDQMNWMLTHTAAALSVYHCLHDEYPEALCDLVPDVLKEEWFDVYSQDSLGYSRRSDGYLLYSKYWNGVDNQGTDLSQPIVNGEWAPPSEWRKPKPGNADLVIRLPLPLLELPFQQSAKEKAE
jgi:hypothetical protein